MDLTLFVILLVLSLFLILLGLYRTEHTEFSLIGFLFLFLLSILILHQDVTYKIGYNTTSNFNYSYVGNDTVLTSSFETISDIYGPLDLDNTMSHYIGYYLAIASVLGFAAMLYGFKFGGFK